MLVREQHEQRPWGENSKDRGRGARQGGPVEAGTPGMWTANKSKRKQDVRPQELRAGQVWKGGLSIGNRIPGLLEHTRWSWPQGVPHFGVACHSSMYTFRSPPNCAPAPSSGPGMELQNIFMNE